jgi:hypothetical protein
MRLGPVLFRAGLSYQIEANDNVNISEEQPEWDVIHRIGGDFNGVWPITQRSLLAMGLDIGYEQYTRGTRTDRIDISPDSELGFDFGVKDFIFTFYERFDYSQEVASEAALSDVQEYPRFNNRVGTRVTWIPSEWIFAVGYSHFNHISGATEFEDRDRSSEQVFGRIGYRFEPRTEIGLELSGAVDDYTEDERSGLSYSAGPYVNWQVTDAIGVSARGGYVYYAIDATVSTTILGTNMIGTNVVVGPVATNVVARDLTLHTYYVDLELTHQLTRHFSHAVSVGRQIRPGVNQQSDYVQDSRIAYRLDWNFLRQTSLSTLFFYDLGEESQVNPQTGEPFKEKFERFGFTVGLAWRLTRQLTSGLNYDFSIRESNQPLRDYRRNSGSLTFRYQF